MYDKSAICTQQVTKNFTSAVCHANYGGVGDLELFGDSYRFGDLLIFPRKANLNLASWPVNQVKYGSYCPVVNNIIFRPDGYSLLEFWKSVLFINNFIIERSSNGFKMLILSYIMETYI